MSERRVTFLISANAKQLETTLNSTQKRLKSFSRGARRIGFNLQRNITIPLGIIAGTALKTAADFETLRLSMETLNGSAEEGVRVFEQLREFAAGTPFRLQDLAQAQNTLQGFGLTADEAFESLQQLGDVSAITGSNISEMARIFGEASAEGKLLTRDLRQIINRAPALFSVLKNELESTGESIFDLAEQGRVSFGDLQRVLRETTSEGGRFFEGTEKQAKSLAGLWSTLRDSVNDALAEIGNELDKTFDIKGVIDSVTEQIIILIKWFSKLEDSTKSLVFEIGLIAVLLGPLLKTVSAIANVLSSLVGVLGKITTAVVTFAVGLKKAGGTLRATFEIIKFGGGLLRGLKDLLLIKVGKGAFIGGLILLGKTIFDIVAETSRVKNFNDELERLLNADFNSEKVGEKVASLARQITDISTQIQKLRRNRRDFNREATDARIDELLEEINTLVKLRDQIIETARVENKLSGLDDLSDLDLTGAVNEGTSMAEALDRMSIDAFKSANNTKFLSKAVNNLKSDLEDTKDVIDNFTLDLSNNDDDIPGLTFDFSKIEKLAPSGSIKALENRAQSIREKLRLSTNAEQQERFRTELARIAKEIEKIRNGVGGEGGLSDTMVVLQDITTQFTNSFGQGLANVIVQGERLMEILNNIGKLLLSSIIQKGISILLTGSSGTGGIFGEIFGFKDGGVVGFANGGVVPGGFPNDSFPALLSSGETVIPSDTPVPREGVPFGPSGDELERAFTRALSKAKLKVRGSDIILATNNARSGSLR